VKILIWQTAFLGDVVLTTPLIRSLQESFPESRIAFVGRPFILELLKDYPIDLIPYSKKLSESFSILKRIQGYDVAVSPHRSLRTALLMLLSRIPLRIGFDRSELRWAFTHVIPHRWDVHEVERNLSLLRPLSPSRTVAETYLPMKEEERRKILHRFGLREGGYIVINPFSNFPLKEWHTEGWIQLMRMLEGHRIVVTGLPSDAFRAEELFRRVSFCNLVGRTSLRDLMAVLSGARLVISNDSSPVHLANAFGVPAVTVYTATSPAYGFYPLIGGYVENPIPCSPCSPNPKKCRRGSAECRGSVSPELVFERLKEFL